MYDPPLEILVRLEPWRFRSGYPSKVDDPQWSPHEHHECDGEIDWEGEGSRHWICQECGYVGWGTHTKHYPVKSPRKFFRDCEDYYHNVRNAQVAEGKLTVEQVEDQKLHVMAVALKKVTEKSPEELEEFIRQLVQL